MTSASQPPAAPHTNRLAAESSPYLLQHAHNPVDWYPWGPEAFAEAQRRQVPIFLSVGYSTCYWCHVMERESFEDEPTAALLNDLFVCIKVDREQHPAVDDIYMAAVQIATGRGGWPMSVFLTPPDADGANGLQPFYAGTYFPSEPRHGMPSFTDICRGVSEAWNERQPTARSYAVELTSALAERLASRGTPVAVGEAQVEMALLHLLQIHDQELGGFGNAPKFPQPAFLELLAEARQGDAFAEHHERLDQALQRTLDAMALGGIHDQIGGGFHRYSTDAKWLVPHFEKMLYDNGQLALLYADSVERTGDAYHARVLRRLCEYVEREMTHPGGGFYSAQDAEVNHHEGENYLWREAEVRRLLEPRDADLFLRAYGLDQGTNFQDPHDPDLPAANVLFLSKRPEQLAADLDMDPQVFQDRLDYMGMRLLEARDRRDQPLLDDKIIAEWNGFMIAGLARAGSVLGEDRFIENAQRAADFLFTHLSTDEGDLLRLWRDGGANQTGNLAPIYGGLGDHAALILGLIELYEATGDEGTLGRAVLLADQARQRFWDAKHGGYYDTVDRADLIVRARTTYDGAIPSGASLMLGNLIRLAQHTRSPEYLADARALLGSLSQAIEENPLATANSTRYLAQLLRTQPDLVKQASDPELAVNPISPVEVEVEPGAVTLGDGESATLTIRVTMAAGVHINASEPGDSALVPTEVQLVGGEGLTLNVTYPTPTLFGMEDDRINVYHDAAKIIVTLTRDGEIAGQPRLILTYQPCTERECLTPVHKVLDVEIGGE